MHGHRAIGIFPGGHVVDRNRVPRRFEKALGVVDGDRPEAIHRQNLDRQAMGRLAVLRLRVHVQAERLVAENPPAVRHERRQSQQGVMKLFALVLISVGHFEFSGVRLCHLDLVLKHFPSPLPGEEPRHG